MDTDLNGYDVRKDCLTLNDFTLKDFRYLAQTVAAEPFHKECATRKEMVVTIVDTQSEIMGRYCVGCKKLSECSVDGQADTQCPVFQALRQLTYTRNVTYDEARKSLIH